jgi:hypothetical protein
MRPPFFLKTGGLPNKHGAIRLEIHPDEEFGVGVGGAASSNA